MKQYATARFLGNALYFLGAVVTIGSLVLGVISFLVLMSFEGAKLVLNYYGIGFFAGVFVLLLSTLVLAVLDIAENSHEILARLRAGDDQQLKKPESFHELR